MKIEKVNENQIRCTLSKEDLEDRQIKLSELAYGSEKAKGLFRDMIRQANYEFGFEADDIPLMVEAIPLSGDHIILQITKVEYPDELDTRFSKFSESDEEEEAESREENVFPNLAGADDVLDLFQKLRKDTGKPEKQKETFHDKKGDVTEKTEKKSADGDMIRMFEFADMQCLERLSHVLNHYYTGENRLYKDVNQNRYYLFVHKNHHTPEEFNKVCNIIVEYANMKKYSPAVESYYKEHCKIILKEKALQTLNSL